MREVERAEEAASEVPLSTFVVKVVIRSVRLIVRWWRG